MKNKTSKVISFLSIATVAFSIFAYFDTRPYRRAIADWAHSTSAASIEAKRREITQELASFSECTANVDSAAGMSAADRECLLDAMGKVSTMMSVDVFATASSVWLRDHPDDIEVRAAALKVIDAGWKDVGRSMPIFSLQDKVSEAHDHSILLRVKDGLYATDSTFEIYAKMLERAEVSVDLPDLTIKQRGRRQEFLVRRS